MVISWRPLRYRGGSGWAQPAIAVAYVGITLAAAQAFPDNILQTTVSCGEPVRSVACDAPARAIGFTDLERTVTFDGSPMPILFRITEHWTAPLTPFTLKIDDVPLNLTGLTVTPEIRGRDGVLVDDPGTWTPDADQTANPGQGTWTPPAAGTFTQANSPYTIRFHAVDGTDKVVEFPNGAADRFEVYKP